MLFRSLVRVLRTLSNIADKKSDEMAISRTAIGKKVGDYFDPNDYAVHVGQNEAK